MGTQKCASTIGGCWAATATVSFLPMPARRSVAGKLAAARRSRPGLAQLAMHDGQAVRINLGGALDKRQR